MNRITRIIQGKQAITGDTALRLGHWFETSAQFWLNLQMAYELRLAEELAGAAAIEALPVRSAQQAAQPRPTGAVMGTPAERAIGAALVTQPEFKTAWDDVLGALAAVTGDIGEGGVPRLQPLTTALARATLLAADLDD